jgi:hypothetical protein
MDQQWAEARRAERPVDRRRGTENVATFQANGTGPDRLRERQPDVRTRVQRFGGWWGQPEGNVDEVIFLPIANDATRVAALASGEVDLIDPVPLQDVSRLKSMPALEGVQGPETRILFFGFDQQRDELTHASVKGANPFKGKRVRQAFAHAIDAQTIVRSVMRGAATPAALIVANGIRGYSPALGVRVPFDTEAARKLLTAAGYPDGFAVQLNCPNDRYVNDSEICQAAASYLARAGIKVTAGRVEGHLLPQSLAARVQLLHGRMEPCGLRRAPRPLFARGQAGPSPRGVEPGRLLQSTDRRVDQSGSIRNQRGQMRRRVAGRPAHPPRRLRPPAAAPAGAGLGHEATTRRAATGRQLHVLQVDDDALITEGRNPCPMMLAHGLPLG